MSEKELEKLYKDAYKAVYWTAISIVKNPEDAEDVVQETFITAFEHYDSLSDKTKAVAWVKKIAANKSLNIVTRRRTVNVGEDIPEETDDIGEDFLPDSMIESEEKRKIIMDIIHNSLSEDTAMTIILFYFDEMSIKEIAELLNIPQGTVLSRLNYAKKKIKKEVEKYEKDNKDKLFILGVPFLTKLFEKEAEQVVFKPMPASLLSLTASSKATGTVAAGAASASAGIVIRNIVIGIIATGVIGAGGFFGYKMLIEKKDRNAAISVTAEDTKERQEPASSPSEVNETEKHINVLGMTPDMLELSGGYMRTSSYHDYSDGTDKADHQLYYNADGLLVLDCLFNKDGVVIYSDYFIYDKDGRVTREELWDATDKPNGEYKEYTYGAHGIERVDSGSFTMAPEQYYEYEYDIQGHLIKVTEYKVKSENVYWFCDYEYESDGSYTTRVTSWNTLKQKMQESEDYCKYSADGKILEDHHESMKDLDMYTYDSQGVLTLMEHYQNSKLLRSTTFEYDANGRLISEKTVSAKGDPVSDYTYEYKDL